MIETYDPASSSGLWGDGSDGDVTLSGGTTSLTRDMFYKNLTLTASAVLQPSAFRIFVKEVLTIGSGSKITSTGGNASGSTGGAPIAAGTNPYFRAATTGGAGGTNAVGSAGAAPGGSTHDGGNGGAGGTSGVNAGAAGGTVTAPTPNFGSMHSALQALLGRYFSQTAVSSLSGGASGGGAGGGTASTGGGGGASGGVVSVWGRNIVNNGSIEANGGNGANGTGTNAGGGGGGGGGCIVLGYENLTGSGTVSATKGTKGTAVGTGVNGTDGSDGTIYTHGALS